MLAPSDQPAAMRTAEMPICERRSPSAISRHMARAMAIGLGRKSGLTPRKLDTACQIATRAIRAAAPPSRLSPGAKPAPRNGTDARRLRALPSAIDRLAISRLRLVADHRPEIGAPARDFFGMRGIGAFFARDGRG